MQGKAEMQRLVFALIVLLAVIIISFVLYAYWAYKKRSLARIAHGQEIFCQNSNDGEVTQRRTLA